MNYAKPPLSPEQHIELLKERGLIISDEDRALRYLENISYFRLSGYMFYHQKRNGTHEFLSGVTFDDIINEYNFDKDLRFLILEYIERIEVALRTQLSNKYSVNHGFFWYNQSRLYTDLRVYNQINDYITEYFIDPQEVFLRSFKSKYTLESLPPSNMAFEILTFGSISKLFQGLKNDSEKQNISRHFKLPYTILASWFLFLTHIRNICAHHSRLWNKRLTANQFIIPRKSSLKFHGVLPQDFNYTVYGTIAIIQRLLNPINETNKFIEKLISLTDKYNSINTSLMGFPGNWKEEPAWKQTSITE
jgi:abortive infection bacteriophage resistance protein